MFRNKRPNNPIHYGYQGQMMNYSPSDFQNNQQYARNGHPYPYQGASQANWHQQPNPYFQQNYQPFSQNFQGGHSGQHIYPQNQYPQKDSQFLFHNPLHPKDDFGVKSTYMPMNGYPAMMNPYPKNSVIQKQPGGMQSLMNSFKSQDGTVDFTKMINTAGQMMNAVNQVSSLVKGFGGIFKA